MRLSDRIDRALRDSGLPSIHVPTPIREHAPDFESAVNAFLSTGPGVVAALNREFDREFAQSPAAKKVMATGVPVYKSLKEAKFSNHTVDEDGIGCVVVESIDNIKLPMKIGNFTIQDIQKRNDGLYTVQFIEE